MSHRRIETMEVMEVLRLRRMGESDRSAAACLGHTRRAVAKYRAWAREQGLLTGGLPGAGEVHRLAARTLPALAPPQPVSSVAAYREEILGYRARGMETAANRRRFEGGHGRPVSYMAVWRLLRCVAPSQPELFVRVETPPGGQAHVDVGYAGLPVDPVPGKPRKTRAFAAVLARGRHCYAELVFDQRIATWLLCHRHAFEWWQGCPRAVAPDDLKAAILHDPVVQRSYRECALHYGFGIDPNPPRMPHLKGKAEQGGVHYLQRHFMAGRKPPERLDDLNRKLRVWLLERAGERIHGTTRERPLARFRETERAALVPLPRQP